MAIFETTINQTVRGFAEDQYVELNRLLLQIVGVLNAHTQQIQLVGDKIMNRQEVIDLVTKTVAEVTAAIETSVTKEKQEVLDRIDKIVVDPNSTLTAEDGVTLKNLILGIGTSAAGKIDEISTATKESVPVDPTPGQI